MVTPGDIFVTTLERGLFGAFRILKSGVTFHFGDKESLPLCLIATTPYAGREKPSLDDAALTRILEQERFSLAAAPVPTVGFYLQKDIEDRFEYLGNIPLSAREKALPEKVGNRLNGGFPLRGPVPVDMGREAFFEWRWRHERERYLAETRGKQPNQGKLLQAASTGVKQMPDNAFWALIALLDRDGTTDAEIIEPVVKALCRRSVSDIYMFEETLAHKLFVLDTKEHAKNIGQYAFRDGGYFSPDDFLYVRCAAVAQGDIFYGNAVKDPKEMPKDRVFEGLLTVAGEAYERKTGRMWAYVPSCSYETFSNINGWE